MKAGVAAKEMLEGMTSPGVAVDVAVPAIEDETGITVPPESEIPEVAASVFETGILVAPESDRAGVAAREAEFPANVAAAPVDTAAVGPTEIEEEYVDPPPFELSPESV